MSLIWNWVCVPLLVVSAVLLVVPLLMLALESFLRWFGWMEGRDR